MVQRLINFFNREFSGLHQAAFLLALSSLVSQLLGLLRDRLLAHNFGASTELDIYYAAFKLPDLIFVSIGSFLAVTVLIPILVEKIEHESAESVRSFLSSLLTFFLISIISVSLLVYIFAPCLIEFVAPGFDLAAKVKLITLTRILLLSPFFLGLSNLFGAVTQSYKRFFIYAISPVLYNVGIISGVLFFYPIFGLNGLVYGVILGALMHFLVQVPTVLAEGYFPGIRFDFLKRDILRVISLSLPRTAALGINQLSVVALMAMASYMTKGSISVFNFAYNLQSVPMALIGISYSVAAFPTMAKMFSSGQRSEFKAYTVEALRHIIFWSMPIAALFIVLRAQIVRTILGSGSFNWDNTRLTAALLAAFALVVVFQSIIQLFDRVYYAMGQTKAPVVVKVVSSLLTIISAYFFLVVADQYPSIEGAIDHIFRITDVPGTRVLFLGLAFSLGTFLNAVFLWLNLEKRDGVALSSGVNTSLAQSILASLLLVFSSTIALRFFSGIFDLQTFWGIFLQGLFSGILGLVVWGLILLLLDNVEIHEFMKSVTERLSTRRPIIPGPEGL